MWRFISLIWLVVKSPDIHHPLSPSVLAVARVPATRLSVSSVNHARQKNVIISVRGRSSEKSQGAAAGAKLDLPLGHDDPCSSRHISAPSVSVADALRPDEILVVIATPMAGGDVILVAPSQSGRVYR